MYYMQFDGGDRYHLSLLNLFGTFCCYESVGRNVRLAALDRQIDCLVEYREPSTVGRRHREPEWLAVEARGYFLPIVEQRIVLLRTKGSASQALSCASFILAQRRGG